MVYIYASILFTLGALILAVLYWRSDYQAGATRSGSQATSRPDYYLLAYGIMILLAIIVPTPVSIAYKAAIQLGLILALLAMVAQVYLKAPPVLLHAIDLLVALLYVITFIAHHPLKSPTLWLLFPVFIAAVFYLLLRLHVAELYGTFVIYGFTLWLLFWQALEVVAVTPALWSWSALSGVIGFIVVKIALATNDFGAQPLVQPLGTEPATTPLFTHNQIRREQTRFAKATATILAYFSRALMQTEHVIKRLAAALRVSKGAQRVAAAAPFLTLLYQWLLVLSVWGLSLTQSLGSLL